METTSIVKNQSNMLMQVAGSKGTDWMVSNYNAWQQNSPLPVIHQQNTTFLMPVANWVADRAKQLNNVMALSFRSIL